MKQALLTQPGLSEAVIDAQPALVVAPLARPGLDVDAAIGLDLILEGFLLHHGTPRHLHLNDAGQRVLAGDFCYASGLTRVAAAGDLRVIEILAELVALSSALVSSGDRDVLAPLWQATATAIADPDRDGDLRAATTALRIHFDPAPIVAHAADLPPAPDLVKALNA